MSKLTRKQVFDNLPVLGYKGKKNDIKSIEKFLDEECVDALSYKGVSYDAQALKALVVSQPDAKTVVVEETEDETEEVPAEAMESAKSVKSRAEKVAEAVQDAEKTKNLKSLSSAVVSSVKSMDEIRWENSNQKSFRSYNNALLFDRYCKSLSVVSNPQINANKKQEQMSKYMNLKSRLGYKALDSETTGQGPEIVREAFIADYVWNVEGQSVIYANARREIVDKATAKLPKVTGGLTWYAPGQNNAITGSQPDFDSIDISMKTMLATCDVSNELLWEEDIRLGEFLMAEGTRSWGQKLSDLFVNGDGTAAYFGVYGLKSKWDFDSADNDYKSVIGGASQSAHTLAHLNTVMGKMPTWAEPEARWFCHRNFKYSCLNTLSQSAGGVTYEQIGNNRPNLAFNGYGIDVDPNMPSTNNQATPYIDAFFINWKRAVVLAESSQGMTMDVDKSVGYRSYSTVYRFAFRFDLQIVDPGSEDTAGVASSESPIIALYQTA